MKKPESSDATTYRRTLIIGYGNTLRGDDGAGPAVVDWIEKQHWPDITTRTAHQLFPEMAEEMAHFERVIFIDASAEPHSTVRIFPVQETSDAVMAHHYSPGGLLRMARELYGANLVAQLITVPGHCFDSAAGISAATRAYIDRALHLIKEVLSQDTRRDR